MPDATETDADRCRRMGWGRGTVLERKLPKTHKRNGTRIRITGVAEALVTGRTIEMLTTGGEWAPYSGCERLIDVRSADWNLVSQPPPPPDYGAAVEKLAAAAEIKTETKNDGKGKRQSWEADAELEVYEWGKHARASATGYGETETEAKAELNVALAAMAAVLLRATAEAPAE